MKIPFTALATSIALVALVACGGEQPASDEASAPAAENASEGAVAYEPAYPEEVSSEGLTEEDVAHQEGTHSHAEGADQEHAEEGHAHGEDADHDHGHDH